jgi:Family of unknown function (DUF6526)
MSEKQTYENHVRWLPPYHFVMAPIMLLNLIFAIVQIIRDFNVDRVAYLIVAIGLVLLALLARTQALTALDRVIRLEERLRYQKLLSPELAAKANEFTKDQFISLRFASDEELPDLVERTLKGEFAKGAEIKKAIKNWRGDYLRV